MRFVDFRRRLQVALHTAFYGETFEIHGQEMYVPKLAGLELQYEILRGRYENLEADAVRKYLSFGQNVIELGGSLGIISRLIRNKIGPDAFHIIVEANHEIVAICARNAIFEKNLGKTELINAALAYGRNYVGFKFGHNANVGRISDSNSNHTIQVKAVKLSDVVEKLPKDATYCLVCDIEGAEFEMLENEDSIFKRLEIGIIEIHPEYFKEIGRSRIEFFKLLEKRHIAVVEEIGEVLIIFGPSKQ